MKIDFYHYNFHEIIQWENIWKACLRRGIDAQLVVEPPGVSTYGMPTHVFEYIINYLNEHNYPYLLQGRYEEADAAVVTQAFEWLHRYKGLKINCHYGVGFSKDSCWIQFKPLNGFDGILLQGEYDKYRIVRNGIKEEKLWVMGYPKLLPLFNQTIQKPALIQKFGIDSSKKTIVYLPSHDVNSSIDLYTDVLGELRHEYNLVIKPHHHNLDKEVGRLNRLKSTGAIVIDYPCSIVDVLAIADLSICDMRSGSYTESIIANVPTIGLFISSSGNSDAYESIGHLLAPICYDAAQLPGLVHAAVNEYPVLNYVLQDFAKPYLFGYFSGHDDDRAVDGLVHFVQSARKKTSVSTNLAGTNSEKAGFPDFSNGLYSDLINLVSKHGGRNILEIGTTPNGARTKAIVKGIDRNLCDTPKLFCIEASRDRHAVLCNEFNRYDFVKFYNALPVDLEHYPSFEEIQLFHNTVKVGAEDLDINAMFVSYCVETDNANLIMQNGIQYVRDQHGIKTFDIALIGNSGFTGTAELEAVYGACYLVLDNVRAYKNHFNYKRLKFDKNYTLYKESFEPEESYAIFHYVAI